ncbi:radical SAM/SPASM domain-containing protein [Streptomyces sp. 7N604]|uniref:radical SAM/SPASM domain-containing protein n=1 Tax=Streptomyces sp. 7N604 TaxID=3457415 RepID=UPI003FCF7633
MNEAEARNEPGPEVLSELGGLSVVELEVGSRCNRACSYCPVSIMPRPPVPARMAEEVFARTLEELARIRFRGRISYHLYNEPLLRVDLDKLVARVQARLPDALQVLNTNGDLLNDRRYWELREAGIDYFYVTRHSPGEYPVRDWQVLQFSDNLILTNRGGTLTHLPNANARMQKTPCHAPAEMLIVSAAGDVLLCYEDAYREHILGNIMDGPLEDIWYRPDVLAARERLVVGDRTVTAMCMKCTNVSHCEPGLSALEEPALAHAGLASRAGAVAQMKKISTEGRGK